MTIQKVVGISLANEDIDLVTVDNGDDAVTRAAETRPDIVLADIVMPGKNGYEVCEALKNDPQLAHVPVLLLTGTFESFDSERAHQAGADGHITKPFEAQSLVDQVNELLAKTAGQAPPTPVPPEAAPPPRSDEAFDFFGDTQGAIPALKGEPLDDSLDESLNVAPPGDTVPNLDDAIDTDPLASSPGMRARTGRGDHADRPDVERCGGRARRYFRWPRHDGGSAHDAEPRRHELRLPARGDAAERRAARADGSDPGPADLRGTSSSSPATPMSSPRRRATPSEPRTIRSRPRWATRSSRWRIRPRR